MVRRRGFTLLELLIVMAMIGVITSIVMVALAESRKEAQNKAIITQVYEYQKALDLYYSDEGTYLHPNGLGGPVPNPRSRIYCFGEGFLTLGSPCIPASRDYAVATTDQINAMFLRHITLLPRFDQSLPGYDYSSPAYSGCISNGIGGYDTSVNTSCSKDDYSIWFLLKGTNQNCGRAYIANSSLSGRYTLCRLQSE